MINKKFVSVQRIVMVYLKRRLIKPVLIGRFRTTNCYGLSANINEYYIVLYEFPYNELLWFIYV